MPNAPCPITAIDQRFVKLGEQRITGIDVDARYRSPAMTWGRVSATLNGSYYIKYEAQVAGRLARRLCVECLPGVATGITPR